MLDRIKKAAEKRLTKRGLVETVEKELGDKAKNVRMEDGSIKAEPSPKFVEEIGSYEEADEKIEEEAKEIIENFTDTLASTARNRGSISKKESKKVKKKVRKELK